MTRGIVILSGPRGDGNFNLVVLFSKFVGPPAGHIMWYLAPQEFLV